MDWLSVKEKSMDGFKKYRVVLLVLLAGVFLMALPSGETKKEQYQETIVTSQQTLEETLSRILSKLDGAGKVEVLLTESSGQQTLYQVDEDRSTGDTSVDIRRETVLVSQSGKGEYGLVCRIDPPTYQGAIVLSQGAENPSVKLALVEAVANATGLTTNRITVLKMK